MWHLNSGTCIYSLAHIFNSIAPVSFIFFQHICNKISYRTLFVSEFTYQHVAGNCLLSSGSLCKLSLSHINIHLQMFWWVKYILLNLIVLYYNFVLLPVSSTSSKSYRTPVAVWKCVVFILWTTAIISMRPRSIINASWKRISLISILHIRTKNKKMKKSRIIEK